MFLIKPIETPLALADLQHQKNLTVKLTIESFCFFGVRKRKYRVLQMIKKKEKGKKLL